MTIAEAPRSLATIVADLAELDAEIERRSTSERSARGGKLEQLETEFASLLVARDRGQRLPPEQIANARQALEDAKLEVQANEHTIPQLTRQREELQREQQRAQADEALAEEQRAELALFEAREAEIRAVLAAIQARGTEYACESARHQARVQLDKLADETGISELRRGVFVFDGAYRPHIDRLPDELAKLCNELKVDIDERGRLVPRAQSAPAPVAAAQPHDDQVDGDIDDEDGLD